MPRPSICGDFSVGRDFSEMAEPHDTLGYGNGHFALAPINDGHRKE
jgi:hypothetical protein